MIQELNQIEIRETMIPRDIFETEQKGISYENRAREDNFEFETSIIPDISGGYKQ